MRAKLDASQAEQASLESKLSAARDSEEAMHDTVAALQIELSQYKSKNGNMGAGLDLFSGRLLACLLSSCKPFP